MKMVVPVQPVPRRRQEAALRDTLALCNQAADLVSSAAFRMRVTSKQSLQRMVYGDLKAMGLSAQPAIHVARKVSGAYATLRANVRAGNLGDPGSKRRVKAGAKPITFRARRRAAVRRPVPVLAARPPHRVDLDYGRPAAGRAVRLLSRRSSRHRLRDTARASRTWCTGTASGSCTPPATSPRLDRDRPGGVPRRRPGDRRTSRPPSDGRRSLPAEVPEPAAAPEPGTCGANSRRRTPSPRNGC